MPDLPVTIVTVTFRSAAVLPQMLASLPAGVPVVIVDNSGDPGGAVAALAAECGARLIVNDDNIGFGAACNRGAALAETEFLLFLNPDAALLPGALEALVAAARAHPGAVALNPRIETATGAPDFKRRGLLVPRAQRLPRGWPAADCAVPTLKGAALFVRRAAFETVGGFDASIFLYHEDDDLAFRLARIGGLMFVRAAGVRHLGGGATPRTPEVAALKARAMGRSRVQVARKHGLPGARRRALVDALVQLASPLAWVSARKRAKQVALLAGVIDAGWRGPVSEGTE